MSAAQPHLRVQMIGGPTVGKTSFVGALALLAEQPNNDYFVTPIDSATKRRFEELRTSFHQGQWPAKTSHSAPIQFRIYHGQQSVMVQLEDFAGEAFVAAMQHGDEGEASQRVETLTEAADMLLLMMDGGKLDSGETIASQPLIQALAQRRNASSASTTTSIEVPVAVLVTKADLARKSDMRTPQAARNRVTQRVPEVVRFLRTHFRPVVWIPLSVCGFSQQDESLATQVSDSAGAAPQTIRFIPTGFEQLFAFWLSLVEPPRTRKRPMIAVSLIGLVLLAAVAFYYHSREIAEQRQRIANPTARLQDLPPAVAEVNRPAYRQRIREALVQASEDLRGARSENEVETILGRFSDLPAAAEHLAHEELTALQLQGTRKQEELSFARVQDAAASQDVAALQQMIREYLQRFPDGQQAEHARRLLASEAERRRLQAREAIKAIVVWDNASLQRKLQRITEYLHDWENAITPSERASIELAVVAARRMLEPHGYQVTLVRTAGLDRPREHGVRITVGGVEAARFDDSGSVSEKVWNRTFSVQWQLGMKVNVTLLNYRFRNSEIATIESRGPMAILMFARTNTATRYSDSFASIRPPVQVQFRCELLDDQTLEAVEAWIYPGSSW